jgi:UDP-N-acetylglucosamine 1-carboxyvinyltransferase
MDRIRVCGGRVLEGEIVIGGAKNAALPLMAAGMLTEERLVLSNVPLLADVATMTALLVQHGIAVDPVTNDGRVLSIGGAIRSTEAPYDIVRKMRASVLVLGPLAARVGEARVSLPGGCSIGTRPVDLHLKGLEQLGAEISLDGGYITARAPRGLKGATIVLPFASVGATENLLMAACLADGQTVIANAAPEHAIVADRIETGTYACAAAITGGSVRLKGGRIEHLGAVVRSMEEAGIEVTQEEDALSVRRLNGLHGTDVMTEPYPGFPTDMQAQFMVLMAVAQGASMLTETIFENRFMHVPELSRMGARINVHGSSAIVRGVPQLSGAPVMATDLRASVSLVLAGLAAKGETIVNRVYHLDRGYEAVEQKLAACGADIERLPG